MTLASRMNELIRAGFSGIWISSQEHQDAIAELAAMARDEGWQLASWNIERGLHAVGNVAITAEASDPLAAVRAAATPAGDDITSIFVLENFHRFLGSAEIVQAVSHAVFLGKMNRSFIVILSPTVQLPPELEKLFVTVEHELPSRDQLLEIAQSIATESGELPEGRELDDVLGAASGLTRYEAEGAYSLSLVRHSKLTPAAIWELKTQTLKKSGLLSLYRGGNSFDSLGGLNVLKAFTRRALVHRGRARERVKPRGVMLLSPPGCGKSEFCKTLGNEVGRPVLILDVGSLMGSLVGQSEERTRQALATVDAMAPCVLMIDEVEKAFAGASGTSGDSGVSSRMFGSFLSWLNDHESDVFVVCTANDIQKLPPEFVRAERFDAVFFLDLPDRKQKDEIWALYLNRYGLDASEPRPADELWTGAEIKSCCRLAALLDAPLIQAAENVVPVAVTSGESVERLRQWADGRCLSAEQTGVYRSKKSAGTGRGESGRRKVNRNPSVN
ncbi:MAG TPA: AAA family ATPase [Planctomycetaceae bacterium]|nr:AAA family ATPase [Planctomycetaceae bacterium]